MKKIRWYYPIADRKEYPSLSVFLITEQFYLDLVGLYGTYYSKKTMDRELKSYHCTKFPFNCYEE